MFCHRFCIGQTHHGQLPEPSRRFQIQGKHLAPNLREGGLCNAVVTKLSPDGQTVVYSTYLGGAANDFASGVALDAGGHIAISGSTKPTWAAMALSMPAAP